MVEIADVPSRKSETWNEWNQAGGPRYPQEKVVQFVFRNYPAKRDREMVRALDLGCGSGVHVSFLCAEGIGHVIGTDISDVGVRNTHERCAQYGFQPELYVAGVQDLAMIGGGVDLVLCIGVYECTGKHAALSSLEGLQKIMTTGARGLFIFCADVDFRVRGASNLGLYGYSRDEVESLFNGRFSRVYIDEHISTYEGGRRLHKDWLVTVEK